MVLYGPTHLYLCAQYNESLRRVLPQGRANYDKCQLTPSAFLKRLASLNDLNNMVFHMLLACTVIRAPQLKLFSLAYDSAANADELKIEM